MAVVFKKQEAVGQGVFGPGIQARLNAAINMAAKLLAKVEDSRLVSIDADLSGVQESPAQVPVIIRAHVANGREVYELEKRLADEVFGPVHQETWVSMPMVLLDPKEDARTEMVSEDGLLFPLMGR